MTYVYSHAFPTPDDVVNIEARDFAFSSNVNTQVFRDPEVGSGGCLLTYNQTPFDRVNGDSATYLIRLARGGKYRLFIEYASKENRSIDVYLNDELQLSNVAFNTGRTWCELRWDEAGILDMKRGLNYLRLQKNNVFPHFKALRLVRTN